jgi:hypothetical protein
MLMPCVAPAPTGADEAVCDRRDRSEPKAPAAIAPNWRPVGSVVDGLIDDLARKFIRRREAAEANGPVSVGAVEALRE